MLAGTPLRDIDLEMRRQIGVAVCAQLAVSPAMLDCTMPRSTKVGTHIAVHREHDDACIARLCAEPVAHVAKVRAALEGNRSARWLLRRNRYLKAW